MGYRLSKIYTKTGDAGTTCLAKGDRIPKDHPACVAMGDVDELNAAIGLLHSSVTETDTMLFLTDIQHLLFELGAEISLPTYRVINSAQVEKIECAIDALNSHLPPLKEFVLPSGSQRTSYCHLARSICRRAERSMVTIQETLNPQSLAFINRLSDYLFVLARTFAKADHAQETLWQHERS